MNCTHPNPIPLGHRAQKDGTTKWGRLGDYCPDCRAQRLGDENAPWIPASVLERAARQAACTHAGDIFATYRRGAMYLNDAGKKVQPWQGLGAECAACGADLLRAPPGPLVGAAAERVKEFQETRRKKR